MHNRILTLGLFSLCQRSKVHSIYPHTPLTLMCWAFHRRLISSLAITPIMNWIQTTCSTDRRKGIISADSPYFYTTPDLSLHANREYSRNIISRKPREISTSLKGRAVAICASPPLQLLELKWKLLCRPDLSLRISLKKLNSVLKHTFECSDGKIPS